jgi:hypothetical protein
MEQKTLEQLEKEKAEFVNQHKRKMVLSSIGFLGGLYYASKRKSGFWGFIGFGFIGALAGATVGAIGEVLIPAKEKDTAASKATAEVSAK